LFEVEFFNYENNEVKSESMNSNKINNCNKWLWLQWD